VRAWGEDECVAWHTPINHFSNRPVAWAPAPGPDVGAKLWTSGASNCDQTACTVDVFRLNDPLNNAVVSVHTYFDADGGGGTDDIADPAIIGQRLQPVVDWARPRGLRVHLSEFGANAAAPGAESAVANALAYLDANADVMTGWSWWAYGPPAWWGAYRFTLCPSGDYAVDDPKMAWLAPHFAGPPGAPTLRPASVTLPAPADA